MFYCHRRTNGKEDILELLKYLKESIRSYFNYHPITISKIWNTAINTIKDNKDSRIKTIFLKISLLSRKKS